MAEPQLGPEELKRWRVTMLSRSWLAMDLILSNVKFPHNDVKMIIGSIRLVTVHWRKITQQAALPEGRSGSGNSNEQHVPTLITIITSLPGRHVWAWYRDGHNCKWLWTLPWQKDTKAVQQSLPPNLDYQPLLCWHSSNKLFIKPYGHKYNRGKAGFPTPLDLSHKMAINRNPKLNCFVYSFV